MRNPFKRWFTPTPDVPAGRGAKRLTSDGYRIVEFPPQVVRLLHLYDGLGASYASLYRTQENVRTVVDFLARNIAQLHLKVYERITALNRVELDEHDLANLIDRPAPRVSEYKLWYATVADLALYDLAYWQKVRQGGAVRGIVRVPPSVVTPEFDHATGTMRGYRLSNGTLVVPDDLVIFDGYDPNATAGSVSALESLRAVLAEDVQSKRSREWFWRNAARREGVIERPADAPDWSDQAREAFRRDWTAAMSGTQNSGKTGILEEGMKWHDTSFSAKDSEFIQGRKLGIEAVARAYHIPPPMIGLLDNATLANVESYHEQLYQDTLAPWLRRLKDEVELQLLPEFEPLDRGRRVYVEFNLQAKLQGSFEKQAATLTSSTGVPWLAVNEARTRLNLSPIGDPTDPDNPFNTPVMPKNILYGGQPAVNVPLGTGADVAPPPPKSKARATADTDARDRLVEEHAKTLVGFFERQRRVVKSRAGAGTEPVLDLERWNRELAEELFPLALGTATYFGLAAARQLGTTYDEARTREYWRVEATAAAEAINQVTVIHLTDGDVDDVFNAKVAGVTALAQARTTKAANWALLEAARQAGT